MSNPVLIELTRGPLVESVHCGAVVVARPDGEVVAHLGDVDRPVFPRSAIKAWQCLPLIESGAADRFGFGDAEIALACASHAGTARHVAVARGMLERIGLGEASLVCGAHEPMSSKAAKQLWAKGEKPGQLHNNCSGKHVGMLATALHLGAPVEGYCCPEHAVQRRIHDVVADLTGLPLGQDVQGIDGCSVPNWAMPLRRMAHAFARLVSAHNAAPGRREAKERILKACWAEPELVAGAGKLDTMVMSRVPGKVFLKTGAEGVYAGAFPDLGWGFALKIDDGTTRASAATAMALVEHVLPQTSGLVARKVIRSWRGVEVGTMRTSADLERMLERLPV